jgi:hypothetical protein
MLEEAFPIYKTSTSALEMASYIFDFALTEQNTATVNYYRFQILRHNFEIC